MLTSIQANFSGGMNPLFAGFNLGPTEYGVAYNVRNRKTTLDPIYGPVEDTALPLGKKQGIYTFDKYILAFVAGRAYYKDVTDVSAVWTQVADLAMSPYEEYIYTLAVPASKVNFARKLANADQISGTINTTNLLVTSTRINGTPSAAIIQDGVSQPWIILPDGSARQTQNYQKWSLDNREYVPIMKQMAYVGGIVFGALGNTIYRSVSGRPLDFVVNVDINGNKGGDASTTSYAATFDDITCLLQLPTGELLAATLTTLSPIQLDYSKTIFGEPTFNDLKSIAAGVVNQFSFVSVFSEDGYNDSFFIDTDGVRSFNAVATEQNEGRNSDFAIKLSESLVAKQTVTAAINYGNYTFLSLKTIYNDDNLVAVYDNKFHQWVSFDNYGIGTIKMFAVANQGENPILYAITTADKLYKLFSAATIVSAEVTLPERTTASASTQVKLADLKVVLTSGNQIGIITATEYTNGYQNSVLQENIMGQLTENITFNFNYQAKQTWRLGMKLSWNTNAKLSLVETTLEDEINNLQQMARPYAN